MQVLQLTAVAKARVSFGQKVTSGFVPEGTATSLVDGTTAAALPSALIVGVEAVVPRGARVEYGFLSVSFSASEEGRIRVEVPFSTQVGPLWTESLAATLDEVRIGLPKEYALAALDAFSSALVGRLPPGELLVSEAAHGAAGSSQRFFGKLASAVVELMVLGTAQPEELVVDRLRALLV